MKLGSLFDGSGGFPLAGSLCGIEPVWASEIEPYPIAVTKSRFPDMKHLGSVTDVHGGEIEPVDIITFGSPCQDLSVAGKRAGLKHEDNGDDETTRSGLFMEAVRIIKEMRKATNGEYPTFAVWENVPGAFSSNNGEDFRTVLQELIKIVEPTAVMPAVPSNGWAYADSYCGDGWSLAYRVFDAQYWGVPQRRRRIYLVLDLRGQRAGEVLFEREGLRGNFAEGRTPWKAAAGDAANRTGAEDRAKCYSIDKAITTGGNCTAGGSCVCEEISQTLTTDRPHSVAYAVPYTLKIRSGCEGGGKGALIQENKSATPATNNGQYLFQPVNMVLDDNGGQQITVRTDGKAHTFRAETHGNIPAVMKPVTIEPGIAAREGGHIYEGVCGTLRANAGDNQMAVAYAAGFKAGQGAQARSIGWEDEKCPMLVTESGGNSVLIVRVKCYDFRGNGDGQTVSTLTGDHENSITDYTSVVVEESPVYCLQGNGIDRADTAGCNGKGWKEGTSYTLNTIDRPAAAYTMQAFGNYKDCGIGSGLKARDYKDATDLVVESAGIDCRNFTEYPELYPTIQAKPNGGQSLNFSGAVRIQYIVRRLTPTECARLQGFPDKWGHPDTKEAFTDEEYRFWLDVRNTHAAINGKQQKNYAKAQMLTWYNKLHTDSSEYKMYGNGIALPCALYVMQGIAEALRNEMP